MISEMQSLRILAPMLSIYTYYTRRSMQTGTRTVGRETLTPLGMYVYTPRSKSHNIDYLIKELMKACVVKSLLEHGVADPSYDDSKCLITAMEHAEVVKILLEDYHPIHLSRRVTDTHGLYEWPPRHSQRATMGHEDNLYAVLTVWDVECIDRYIHTYFMYREGRYIQVTSCKLAVFAVRAQ